MSGSAQALDYSMSCKLAPEGLAGVLAASVRMKDAALKVRILLMQLPDCVDAQLFLHVVSHFQSKDFSGKAIHDRGYIQFSVRTLNLRDVRKKLA